MRSEAIWLAALLVTAGCIGVGASTEDITSLEDQARDRAEDRLEDPKLIQAFAVEPLHHTERNDTELWVYVDEAPGDGKAPGWAFHFVGEEREGIVVVAAGVGILAEYWEEIHDEEDRDGPPIQGWEISSEEAAGILMDEAEDKEDWPAVNQSYSFEWELSMDEALDDPVWQVAAQEGIWSWGGYHAKLNARTGEVLEMGYEEPDWDGYGGFGGEDPYDPGEGGCSSDQDSGAVTPAQGLSASATADDGPVQATVSWSLSGAGTAEIVLSQDDEAVWSEEVTVLTGESGNTDVHDLEPGEYTLSATTETGAFNGHVNLQLTWGSGQEWCMNFDWGPGHTGDGPAPTPSPSQQTSSEGEQWAWERLWQMYR